MNVLVVGGSRFVGLELTARLLLEGHDVSVLSLDAPPAEVAPHVRWLRADRNKRKELERALAGLSFEAVIDNIAYEPPQVEKLAAALNGRVGRYVLTSSVDIYGLHVPRGFPEDQAPLEPNALEGTSGHDRYVRGKRGCELALRKTGVAWTVLRPGLVCGRRDNVTPPPFLRHLALDEEASRSLFFPSRVLDGGPILLRQDDEAVFRLAWVQDVARAVVHVLGDPRAANEAFNVVGDEVWTHEKLVRALCHAAGRDAQLVWVSPYALSAAGLGDYDPAYGRGPYWSVAESHKLKSLGWKPTPAEQWLPKLVEAAAAHRPSYERRLAELALATHLRRRHGPVRGQPARARAEHAAPSATVVEEPSPPLEGRISAAASAAWRAQVEGRRGLAPSWFRSFGDATVSGLGLGSWMGDTSAQTDALYVDAMVHAVRGGINVLDTAINYRFMKAERCVGAALRRLASEGVPRDAVLVATKAGFVTHDALDPRPPQEFIREEYVRPGLVSPEDAKRAHALGGRFVRAQLDRSRRNLGLAHVDLFYLHNPELHRETYGPEAFRRALREAFEVLESAVSEGLVGAYGLATWTGLRARPEEPSWIALEEALEAARAAGGERHHLRAVQLPFNVRMPEAYTRRNQPLFGRRVTALQACAELGLHVFTSASVLQGALGDAEAVQRLARAAPGRPPAVAALQFARSAPGVGTALVGLRRLPHVDEALSVGALEPLTAAEIENLCE